jgi:hypothetical protein
MAEKQSTAFCHVCNQQRLYMKPRINHVLHLILTIVTAGLWGIVWIILGISNSSKPLRCTACGTPMGAGAAVPMQQPQSMQRQPPPPPPPPAVPEGTPPPAPPGETSESVETEISEVSAPPPPPAPEESGPSESRS